MNRRTAAQITTQHIKNTLEDYRHGNKDLNTLRDTLNTELDNDLPADDLDNLYTLFADTDNEEYDPQEALSDYTDELDWVLMQQDYTGNAVTTLDLDHIV